MSAPSAPPMGGGDACPSAGAPGYPPQVPPAYPTQGGGFTAPAAPGQPIPPGASPYPSAPSPGGGFGPPPAGSFPSMPNPSSLQLLPTGDSTAQLAAPSQPGFINLPGFADSSFTPTIQPPTNPYFDNPIDHPPKYDRAIPPIQPITEEEAIEAVRSYADKKCCYGKPTPLKVQNLEMKSAFKYELMSFTEKRETVWKSEAYSNQAVEGPAGTGVLGPWDIAIYPDAPFKDHEKHLKIPNTSYIQMCHHCAGGGTIRCHHCGGMGMQICNFCRGSGVRFSNDMCTSCGGAGRRMCTWCHSQGWSKCNDCNGRGQLYMYLQLIATWKCYSDVFVSDHTAIPDDEVGKASGSPAVSEQHKMVAPFIDFPDSAITNASRDLIGKHARAYTSQMIILEQKQSVEVIPIAEITYSWRDKSGTFHVYGDNRHIYFPDYPSTCCGCCTII